MASRLLHLVADELGLPVAEVGPLTGPGTTGEWVSVRHLRIVAAVEDAYGVSISPREIRAIRSVGDLQELLRQRGIDE